MFPVVSRPTLPRLALLVALCIAAPALAERGAPANDDWSAVQGHWRLDEIPGCGIDDVRAGRIVSVTDRELRYGQLLCTVLNGAPLGGSDFRVQASCEIASDVESVIIFDWDMATDAKATLTVQNADRPIWRCAEILE